MLYARGKYQVEISDDGLVKVKPGDWLSKYAVALGNDLGFVLEFRRIDAAGNLIPIEDLNLIHAGETLAFAPFYRKPPRPGATRQPGPPPRPQPAPKAARKLSDDEQERIKEMIARNFDLRGDHLPILSKVIDYVGYADGALTILQIAGVIGETTAAGAVATGASLASPVLGAFGAVIGVVNAWEFGQRLHGLRAVAYGSTAWAFDHPRPVNPPGTTHNIRIAGRPQDIPKYERAWREAVDASWRELEATVQKKRLAKESYQMLIRAVGDGEPKQLARVLLAGLRDKHCKTPNEKAMIWSPEPNYPRE